MKVALDATPLSVPTGGIARYTVELASALQQEFPEDSFSLLLQHGSNALMRRWWSIGLPVHLYRRGFDLFHGTDFAVPYLPLKPSVITVHDLSPFLPGRPAGVSARVSRRTPFLVGLGLATIVVTPTEVIRRQAIEHFGLHPSRTVAVPLAAGSHFRRMERSEAAAPYFLFVGTLEPRKNLGVAMEAWRQVKRLHDVDLVLAGRMREDFEPPRPEPGLRLAGMVSEDELPALYSGATAVVFPSSYEGFGLPLLEAMQCGAPVIASKDAALMEVSGGAALHVAANDRKAWAEAMRTVLESTPLRKELSEKGLHRAAMFGWDKTARRMRAVYQEAIDRFAS
ncbi:MAG: glycosyltransferase family 4 protein [Acidimicrobiia bacterium]|nr:glycosyltransferase family 4 protein [Acidimicrobiia bacterium]